MAALESVDNLERNLAVISVVGKRADLVDVSVLMGRKRPSYVRKGIHASARRVRPTSHKGRTRKTCAGQEERTHVVDGLVELAELHRVVDKLSVMLKRLTWVHKNGWKR